MSLSDEDFAAYFDRIGWDQDPRPDRATLAALVELHAAAIPFENLNPFVGRAVDLAPAALVRKLVRQKRGGYCFEQNGLLAQVIARIGFQFTPLAARVLWMAREDAIMPRTHMLLLVHLPEGPVLADVGFGAAVCTTVLDLVADRPQSTPHERFRLVRPDGEWRQQIEVEGEWRTTYKFDLTPQLPIDYELANWWTSAHPSSHFTQGLIAARSPAGRRLALRNLDFAVHALGGGTERRRLDGPEEACAVLERDFGIEFDDRATLMARLAAVA